MKIIITKHSIVYINLDEKKDKDYYYSKLCFNDRDEFDNGEQINVIYSSELSYDAKRNEFIFPNDVNEYQNCFLLRLVIDSIQLKRGNLPLHASAISDGNIIIIISAKSGKGKSFIADEICKMYKDYYTIGDDHIILSSNCIQGNMKRRIRNDSGEECYFDNKGLDDIHKVFFISFVFSPNNMCVKRVGMQEAYTAFTQSSAFKYLSEIFEHKNIRYSSECITDVDITDVYQRVFYSYMKEQDALCITGTPQYAIEYISNMIAGNGNIYSINRR